MATPATAPNLAEGETLSFSLPQREIWLDQQSWPGSAHLNIGGGAYLVGAFDLDLFRAALARLVAESEALRLVPLSDGGQVLRAAIEPQFDIVDVSDSADPRAAMRDWWNAKITEPFPLDGRPPWQFTLLRGGGELHGLTIQFHHLIMDGWGTVQVMRRWAEIYNALATGAEPPALDGRPYREAIAESLAYRQSAAFGEDAAYWQAQLPVLPPPLVERRAAFLPGEQLPKAHVGVHRLRRADYERLNAFAGERGVTAFTVLLAALMIYFARISRQREVVVGVPNLNRGGKRYKNTLGMFVGVFPLRMALMPEMPASDLLTALSTALRGALRHPRYPLSELGRGLQLIRQGRDALFDVLLSFERQDYALSFGAAKLQESRQLFSGLARYPLGLTICEFHPEQDLELVLEASSAYFLPQQAELIGRRFWHLVESLMASPDAPIGSLELLPAEERWALLDGVHQDVASLPAPQAFISHFEHHAALRPQAPALVWDEGEMDYGRLDRAAGQLAQTLVAAGAGRDKVVAFALERSPEMVLAVLAIAKAGAAFLALDADAPLARLADILQDSQACLLLVQAQNRERFAQLPCPLQVIGSADLAGDRAGPALPAPQPNDLAYVLFTSGSTGRPKGVMIEHAALARRLAWLSRAWGIEAADRSGLATQITFDPSLIELCLPLIHGASIALPPPGRLAPETLPAFAERHGVSFMAFVPSTLRRFAEAAAQCPHLRLRVACCGGEVLPPELARQFSAATGARLFNVYGPTETAIFATAWPCAAEEGGAVLPVGRPIDDTRVYVLDAELRPLPFYETGDVYLGGVVARGYLNRPDLDAAAFVADPFVAGGRMYRTGDLGWLSDDGSLYFVGRSDRQIKLRGYRIELGEIEAALLATAGVRQAAVQLLHVDGRPGLHAWVALATGCDVAGVQESLRRRLPDYMLPASLSPLPELPESSSGKIDYARLPAPQSAVTRTPSRSTANALERDLLAVWERALGKQGLGVADNFFDLGGDSLAAVEILAGVTRLTGRRIPLYLLTENPSVESLAAVLGVGNDGGSLMLQLGDHPGGCLPLYLPLYLAASGYGDFNRFCNLAKSLGPPFVIHMLQPAGRGEFSTVDELAALYAERIAVQAVAPGYVAGFSVAGIVALETARLLMQRGVTISGLILIDSVYPGRVFRAARFWRFCNWLVRVFRLQDLSLNGRHLGSMFGDPALAAQVRAIADYAPAKLEVPVLLVKTTGMLFLDRWFFGGWRRLFGSALQEKVISGMHGSLFEADKVEQLAAVLRSLASGRIDA